MLIIKNKKMLKNEITENKALSIASVSGSTFVNADCFDVFPFIEDKSNDAIPEANIEVDDDLPF